MSVKELRAPLFRECREGYGAQWGWGAQGGGWRARWGCQGTQGRAQGAQCRVLPAAPPAPLRRGRARAAACAAARRELGALRGAERDRGRRVPAVVLRPRPVRREPCRLAVRLSLPC